MDPYFADGAKHDYDSLSTRPRTASLSHTLKLLHLLAYQPSISTAQLAGVKCPTLVIGGDHDIILPQHTMLIAQSIPKSYLWILPNAGHATPIYHSEAFNNTVLDFFKNPYRKIEKGDRGS